VYFYNKNTIKSLPFADIIVNKIIKSYFSFEPLYNNKKSRHIEVRMKRLSLNKILVSKAKIEHTNNKVIITLYTYNRNKKVILHKVKTLYNSLFSSLYSAKPNYTTFALTNDSFNNTSKTEFVKNNSKYDILLKSSNNTYLYNNSINSLALYYRDKINENSMNVKYISFYNLINICNNKLHIALNKHSSASANAIFNLAPEPENVQTLMKNSLSFVSKNLSLDLKESVLALYMKKIIHSLKKRFNIKTNSNVYKENFINSLHPLKSSIHISNVVTKHENMYVNKLVKALYKKEMMFNFYVKMLYFNTNKFKKWFLLGLKKIISNIYKKNVEFNLINLKYIHLNSNLLSESITTKLRNRENRLLKVLKKSLFLTKFPFSYKSYLYNKEFYNTSNTLALSNLYSSPLRKNIDILHKWLNMTFNKNYYLINNFTNIQTQYINILNYIKYKAVFGVRLEATGRLTKRLTASRSVSKLKYKGSSKNIDSSYKGLPSMLMRGSNKSNTRFTKINSKTRNGSFGLKGWISGY